MEALWRGCSFGTVLLCIHRVSQSAETPPIIRESVVASVLQNLVC